MHTHCFSSLEKALDWVNCIASTSRTHIDKSKKLSRIQHALALLHNPHKSFKSIHITGSKGKSSTAFAASYMLMSAHMKTGLFTSPHIHTYNERIRINQEAVSDDIFLDALNVVHALCQSHSISLTMFEILTICACVIFKREKVQYAVFEVGIGGKYDSTNFLAPVLCIITSIEKEHLDILGNTIQLIAKDKAGIIKPHTPVWLGKQTSPIALEIIREEAEMSRAPLYYLPDIVTISHVHNAQGIESVVRLNNTAHAKIFHAWDNITVFSPTISSVIMENQILADIATHTLLHIPPHASPHKYTDKILLLCRAELLTLSHAPPLFLDGAHTIKSIHASLQCVQSVSKNIVLIIALSKGKDHVGIGDVLVQHAHLFHHIIVTRAGTFKETNPHVLYHVLAHRLPAVELIENEQEAASKAKTFTETLQKKHRDATTVVMGSFYLCADCRVWWLQQHNNRASIE